MQQIKGFDEKSFIEVHQSGAQLTSVRLNPNKSTNYYSLWETAERVAWSSQGLYLKERPSFTLDPLFHAGAYYVQEASSMFLEEALKQTVDLSAPLKVLDLCAAPGGKSTLIQSLISTESLLVSNEVIKARVNILAENISKWGAANVVVTNNDPKDFQRLEQFFDVIVVDAPCSGSGLFRKDPNAINEWSDHNVALCAQRQQRILADILPSLKEGGIVIYSTCSYSFSEDEAIADWMVTEMGCQSLKLNLHSDWGIVETRTTDSAAFGYRFYPDKVKGEGFFIAAFKKGDAENTISRNQKPKEKKGSEKLGNKELEIVKPWLNNNQELLFFKQLEDVLAIPTTMEEDFKMIKSTMYIKKAGVKLGSIIRNELIPAHDLAISIILHPTVPRLEVDLETALQYLRKADIKIDSELRGWVLLTYQQLPVGWIKAMSNRINNYYPKEWRILNK